MGSDWKSHKVGDLANSISTTHLFNKKRLIFLNTSDILGGKVLHNPYKDIGSLPGQAKKTIKKDDILLSEIRPANGRYAFIDFEADDYVVSTKLMVIRARENILPKFLFYFLTSKSITNWLQHLAESRSGTFPQITFDQIAALNIKLPDRDEQQKIIAHIGPIDEKVELNRQMNRTLEKIGQALFKHWFIDFEFPNEEGNPYKSSGGEMVDSELGEIPKGWKVKKVGEVIDIFGGTTPSTKEQKYWEGGTIHWATPKDLSDLDSPVLTDTERKITPEGLATISSGLLPVGTVLLSSRAPIGYMAISQIPVSINQGFIAMVCSHELPNYYVFSWVQYNLDIIKSVASGTTFEEVNKSNFRRLDILVPPSGLLSKFSTIFGSLYECILNNSFQTRTLASVRDSLLPRLMSGQIRVRMQ